MATGTAGSSFTSELNRLANGGTYPSIADYKAPVAAANAWNGTEGLGLIAALNQYAETNRQPDQYLGLGAVCNQIAGTDGLSPTDALRSINL